MRASTPWYARRIGSPPPRLRLAPAASEASPRSVLDAAADSPTAAGAHRSRSPTKAAVSRSDGEGGSSPLRTVQPRLHPAGGDAGGPDLEVNAASRLLLNVTGNRMWRWLGDAREGETEQAAPISHSEHPLLRTAAAASPHRDPLSRTLPARFGQGASSGTEGLLSGPASLGRDSLVLLKRIEARSGALAPASHARSPPRGRAPPPLPPALQTTDTPAALSPSRVRTDGNSSSAEERSLPASPSRLRIAAPEHAFVGSRPSVGRLYASPDPLPLGYHTRRAFPHLKLAPPPALGSVPPASAPVPAATAALVHGGVGRLLWVEPPSPLLPPLRRVAEVPPSFGTHAHAQLAEEIGRQELLVETLARAGPPAAMLNKARFRLGMLRDEIGRSADATRDFAECARTAESATERARALNAHALAELRPLRIEMDLSSSGGGRDCRVADVDGVGAEGSLLRAVAEATETAPELAFVARSNLALLLLARGRSPEAIALYREALEGAVGGAAETVAVGNLGFALCRSREAEAAEAFLERFLERAAGERDAALQALASLALSRLSDAAGDALVALAHADNAFRAALASGDQALTNQARTALGIARGNHALAKTNALQRK